MSFNLKLKAHDQVALLCTGSICTHPEHPQLVQDYLKARYQLQATFAHDTTQSLPPAERARIFLNYLMNDDIKLIAALRGGEGTADILPYLHLHHDKIKRLQPKIILGLSDFTALLVYFEKYYQWPVIHGPSLLQCALNQVDDKTEKSTMDWLFGINPCADLNNLTPLNDVAKENNTLEGHLTGGNLSLLEISIKDLWEIETANKIIFLEDCAEKAHKIIRTLKYLSRIGVFENIKAVILGDFTCTPIGCEQIEQENNRKAILKVLSSFAQNHAFPVFYTTQFGHGKTNLPLVYSMPYRLQSGQNPKLQLAIS